ncbi:hypothetical protein AALP_AA5G144700 [Arabis alpina]|uniref:Uncharacterized protein n=1 Tax=Arabis alpina TaxID=50452 RepID=A0A087GX35_ARAAL|nr:hypothetical protein AALP_AA5G144700 [Arabis alpina]
MLLILEAPSGITRRTICVDVVHSRKPQLLASFLPPSTRPPPSVRSLSRKAEAPVYSGCGVMTSPASISLRPEPPDLPSLESSPPPEPLDLLTLECSPPPEPPDTPNLSPSLSYVSPKLYETRSGFLSSFRRLVVTTSVSSPSFPSRSLLPWPTAQGLTIGLTKSPSPLLRSTVRRVLGDPPQNPCGSTTRGCRRNKDRFGKIRILTSFSNLFIRFFDFHITWFIP